VKFDFLFSWGWTPKGAHMIPPRAARGVLTGSRSRYVSAMRGRGVKFVGAAGVIRRIILAPRGAGGAATAGKSRIVAADVL
jgi:hypothetical protein